MEKYALCERMYEGDKFPRATFIFEALSIKDAGDKAFKWAMYHGLNYRLDIEVRPAHQNELTMRIHNEYLVS